jgi:hypothetical protein
MIHSGIHPRGAERPAPPSTRRPKRDGPLSQRRGHAPLFVLPGMLDIVGTMAPLSFLPLSRLDAAEARA